MVDLLANGKVILQGVELILLDKDGTLIDIHHYWSSMILRRTEAIIQLWFAGQSNRAAIANRIIDELGFDQKTGLIKPDGPVGVKPRRVVVDVAQCVIAENGVQIATAEVEILFQQVDRDTSKNLGPVLKLLPGVEDFLVSCQKNNVTLAAVSADMTERVRLALGTLKIDHYFAEIVGGDLVVSGKPAPDPARKAMQLCQTPPWKTASIGDHTVDMEMGIRASIPCNIAVLTGLGQRDDFRQQPCYMINSFQQLKLQPGHKPKI